MEFHEDLKYFINNCEMLETDEVSNNSNNEKLIFVHTLNDYEHKKNYITSFSKEIEQYDCERNDLTEKEINNLLSFTSNESNQHQYSLLFEDGIDVITVSCCFIGKSLKDVFVPDENEIAFQICCVNGNYFSFIYKNRLSRLQQLFFLNSSPPLLLPKFNIQDFTNTSSFYVKDINNYKFSKISSKGNNIVPDFISVIVYELQKYP